MAEEKARKNHPEMPEFGDWTAPVVWVPKRPDGSELEIPAVTLDEVFPAITLAPQFVPHEISIGIGQIQQMWAAVAVPVCRQKHIGAQSILAIGG